MNLLQLAESMQKRIDPSFLCAITTLELNRTLRV